MMAPADRADDDGIDTRVEAVPAGVFWSLAVIGLAVIGFGLYGVWVHRGTGILDVRLRPVLTWTLGAIVVHDLIVAPASVLIGRGLRRVRPRLLRAPLQAGLATTALLTLLAFPLVRGYGARAGAPSRLPRNYTVGYLALLGVVWAGCAAWAWWRIRHGGTAGRGDGP
jgi:hypothetical protein